MNRLKTTVLMVLIVAICAIFSGCMQGNSKETSDPTGGGSLSESESKGDSTLYYNGGEISLLPTVVKKYLESENKAEYLAENSGTLNDVVKQLSLEWSKSDADELNFELATDADFENVVYSAKVKTNEITLQFDSERLLLQSYG